MVPGMGFSALPPGMAKRLIQGIDDQLTPLAKAQQQRIARMPCPRCHSAMEPHIHAAHAFTPGELLPRTLARCVDCTCTVDPKTGLVLDVGDPRLVEDALPIIRPSRD